MQRHWLITDSDGSNPRHVTLAQYVEEVARSVDKAKAVRLAFIESDMRHPAPRTLDQAAQPLANC